MNHIEIFPLGMTRDKLHSVICAAKLANIHWLLEYNDGDNIKRIFRDDDDMLLFYLGMTMGAKGKIQLIADDASDLILFRFIHGL